jgi:uncharacterized membrane protein YbhN (UPF0104 family)
VWLAPSLLLLAALSWYALPRFADFSTVGDEIRAMTGIELTVLGLVALWNLATYWATMVIVTPGMTWRQAMVATESTTAVANTVPGGGAIAVGLTYAMFGSWGFSKSRTTLSLVVSGIWNNFVKLGMPVLVLALMAFQGDAGGSHLFVGFLGIGVLVAAVAVFAMILRSERFAARAGEVAGRAIAHPLRLLHRPAPAGWDDATVTFRARVIGLVRHTWIRLTVTTLVGHLSLYLVLLVSLRQVGVSNADVSWIQVLATFAFVRLLTVIPVTPGGLGIVDLGLIAGLAAAGGDHAEVVAAVLVYRLLTFVLPIAFGLVTYLYWRRNTSWRNSAPAMPAPIAGNSAPAMSAPIAGTVPLAVGR